jgi:asparagine synthetase B (glutamine-hydrolysing)
MNATSPYNKVINDYLHYGYLPPDSLPDFIKEGLREDKKADYTTSYAGKILDRIFTESVNHFSGNGFCIVPVSGGWDSRILLGLALEYFSARQIKTYSFGTKGQLDYDIGKKLANEVGVEHVEFDLSKIALTYDELKKSVSLSPWTYVPDAFFNSYCYKQMAGNQDIILSGFMGDPLTGGHSYKKNGPDIPGYFAKSQTVAKNHSLTQKDYNPAESLPETCTTSTFLQHEQLDLGVRQANCIVPIISSKNEWNQWGASLGIAEGTNAEIIAPFAHKEWIRYWQHAPSKEKNDRRLYLKLLEEKFPVLASLPAKDFYGSKRRGDYCYTLNKKRYHGNIILNRNFPKIFPIPRLMMNYLDYDTSFRRRDDYISILKQAVSYLNETPVSGWINFNGLQKDHQSYRQNLSKEFLLLIGLALNLEVADEKT